mgnify:FL=1
MSEFIRIPVTKKSIAQRSSIHGVGINDAEYMVYSKINGKLVPCPFYRAWRGVIERSSSKEYKKRSPSYRDCTIVSEWTIFSNFRDWMETQDWKGKAIDKDILIPGNKEYGPASCLFVTSKLNNLLTNNSARRGDLPQGVYLDKGTSRYRAMCRDNGKKKSLGTFGSLDEAEYEYLIFKSRLIRNAANGDEACSNKKLKNALMSHSEIFNNKAKELRSRIDGLSEFYKGKLGK